MTYPDDNPQPIDPPDNTGPDPEEPNNSDATAIDPPDNTTSAQ